MEGKDWADFVRRQNIAKFKARLRRTTDDSQRKVIETLLAEELCKEAQRLKRYD
jgi:hypothetical protein